VNGFSRSARHYGTFGVYTGYVIDFMEFLEGLVFGALVSRKAPVMQRVTMGCMATRQVTFRVDPAKVEQLEQIAKSLDRDRSYVLNEAIDNYIELHRWQLAEIEAGIADEEAGRTYSTDQVREHIHRYIDEYNTLQERVKIDDPVPAQ
jgi:predicted transcriptional regulator